MAGTLAKGVTIAVSIAGVGMSALVGGALSGGADLEQSIGGIETLFKDDSGVVKANADKAFKTAGLSANDYMETVTGFSASLLQSLGGDTAKAAEMSDMAIVDMADNANKMGTSMESIQNAYSGFAKQNYTMLDNLKLGYGGTKEEMQRLLSDAQEISGVEYDISNLADVYNAIHVIQENLDISGTTAKEASETFSGSLASMKSAFSNLLGNMAIGGDVKTSMEDLVDSASTFLIGNAVPMIGNVISALPGAVSSGIKKAVPKIKKAAPEIIKGIKDGLSAAFPSLAPVINQGVDSVTAAFPELISGAKEAVSAIVSVASGFAPMIPQMVSFGSSMIAMVQSVVAACAPALTSIISTVQTLLPVIIPVISTVVTTIGDIIAQAAPVISGLVEGIGTVVTELAPVFSTIFSEIGEKVGSVIGFVSERMGFIQEVIGAAAPVISDVISTAWNVISPVMDIMVSVFEILFGVVKKVFPGIQSIIETVWDTIKPIVEGIGSVVSNIAGWFGSVADAITGSGADSTDVGSNAEGSNNWKGGLTWVGEKGAELVELPKGSRILPNKESVALTAGTQEGGIVKNAVTNVVQNVVSRTDGEGDTGSEPLYGIMDILKEILAILRDEKNRKQNSVSGTSKTAKTGTPMQVIIQKIADQITVREDDDIDEIADRVAKKVLEVVLNMG
jgi:phage-related protein